MRINLSTIFQVVALIAQDILAYEAQQKPEAPQPKVEAPLTTESPAPVS